MNLGTITDVSLVHAESLKLTEAVLVELMPEEPLLGFGAWGPDDTPALLLPENWEERIDAVHAKIKPKEEWNLVFALTSSSPDTGSADSIKKEYKDTE
ncbi:hypothetical protein P6709_15515 [Jeotgalibacillus sp. ET6]|uniref:hypothetical protein n=1 Tax=Jeotgalibacillus sp. ET6 TaxID=3037260 RepID=UPI0024186482|nr:hypothetical protein [Jeotgalibacillus sp. ET6]MDG5473161.1 hypothetical protein [Jeotgalibacillus sp. ET6]